jgi:hypothetical protein
VSLRRSAGARRGPVRRRKKANPGTRPHPADGPVRTFMVAVPCRFDRPQHAARSPSGVHPVLNPVEREVPVGTTVHAILDKYAAYMRPAVQQRIERYPRLTFHLTPTSVSWLKAVEGFFDTLTKRTEARRLPIRRRPPGRDQSLSRRSQRQFQTIRVGRRSRQSHRRRQTRAPKVRFDLLAPSRLRWVRAVTPTRVAAFGGYTANEPGRPARGGRPAPTPPCG